MGNLCLGSDVWSERCFSSEGDVLCESDIFSWNDGLSASSASSTYTGRPSSGFMASSACFRGFVERRVRLRLESTLYQTLENSMLESGSDVVHHFVPLFADLLMPCRRPTRPLSGILGPRVALL